MSIVPKILLENKEREEAQKAAKIEWNEKLEELAGFIKSKMPEEITFKLSEIPELDTTIGIFFLESHKDDEGKPQFQQVQVTTEWFSSFTPESIEAELKDIIESLNANAEKARHQVAANKEAAAQAITDEAKASMEKARSESRGKDE